MNITFLDTDTVGQVPNLDIFSNLGDFRTFKQTAPDKIVKNIGDSQVIITNKVNINKETMDACPGLKLICIAATGMNNVDLDYARKKGILVKNVSDYSTESVAQSTFAMIFAVMGYVSKYDNYVKSGQYAESGLFTCHAYTFNELNGKTIGIIGLGHIGRRVAEISKAFGMEVLYFSTTGKNTNMNYEQVDLNKLLNNADIVTIHAPLNEKTHNLITMQEIKLMKKEAIIINMARGGIINEADLAKALDEDMIAGAGTDVFTHEPVVDQNPLLHVKDKGKIILTPHIAWAGKEARMKLMDKIYKNIEDFIDNGNG